MRCPCGAATPAPLWKFCETCATDRLRRLFDPSLPAPSPRARRYKRGDLVTWVHGPAVRCRIIRHPDRLGNCVLVNAEGERFYAHVVELRLDEQAASAPAAAPEDPDLPSRRPRARRRNPRSLPLLREGDGPRERGDGGGPGDEDAPASSALGAGEGVA